MPLHLPALRFVLLQLRSLKGLRPLDRARFRSFHHGAGRLRGPTLSASIGHLYLVNFRTFLLGLDREFPGFGKPIQQHSS